MKYDKSPLDTNQQISHLENSYNIKCSNLKLAKKSLLHINYYKLRGYWLFYEDINQRATFEEVINLYEFDKKLRVLFLEYIEIVESSIKSIFTNYLTVKYNNSHIHLDNSIFENKDFYNKGITQLKKSFNTSNEIFIKHFKIKYDEELPPLWVCVECMTFGEISKWYKNLNREDKKEIAKFYNTRERYLSSFLIHLTEIRNISAHHSRLCNRVFSQGFQIPHILPIQRPKKFKIYHSIMIFDYLLHTISDNHNFLNDFHYIVKKYNIPLKYMGFNREHQIEELKGCRYE